LLEFDFPIKVLEPDRLKGALKIMAKRVEKLARGDLV
jgi:hypothetical protein